MRAILSVSDKTGMVELGRGLAARGVELVSTGGTAKALPTAGLPVTNVSDVTGFPEMMDGRVKTLHPAIHGGILARRNRPDDLAAHRRARHRAWSIWSSSTCIRSRRRPPIPRRRSTALVEEIDIGGPSLVRAAAKNFRDVLVVVDPADYPRVLEELRRAGGPSLAFRFELMRKAFAHTGAVRRDDCDDAGSTSTSTDGAIDRGRRHAPTHDRCDSETATCATARTRTRRRAWYGASPDSTRPDAGRCIRARNCRTRTCSTSTPPLRIALEFAEPAGGRHQAHQSVRRRDRRRLPPTPTSAPATPIRSRRSAASSPSTARSTGRRQQR